MGNEREKDRRRSDEVTGVGIVKREGREREGREGGREEEEEKKRKSK